MPLHPFHFFIFFFHFLSWCFAVLVSLSQQKEIRLDTLQMVPGAEAWFGPST